MIGRHLPRRIAKLEGRFAAAAGAAMCVHPTEADLRAERDQALTRAEAAEHETRSLERDNAELRGLLAGSETVIRDLERRLEGPQ